MLYEDELDLSQLIRNEETSQTDLRRILSEIRRKYFNNVKITSLAGTEGNMSDFDKANCFFTSPL